MKRFLNFTVVYFFISTFGQSADIPDLIPKSINKKTGYIDQKGNVIIEPQYHIAMFFAEDCNLLNSPKENLRQFGSADFATVSKIELVTGLIKQVNVFISTRKMISENA